MSQPATAASFLLRRAHIDPRLANFVLGGLPFHVAVGEATDGSVAFAIAMRVRDLKATESTLATWDAGAHRTVAGMELLSPLVGPDAPQTAVGLAPSGYLVLASSESGLSTFGPYVSIALPAKPAAESSLELRAARGALAQAGVKATNLAAWATSNLLGLLERIAPPVFDARAFVACVNPLLVAQTAMLADLQDARVDVDTGNGELHATATLTPKAGDNPARRRLRSMHPADAAPLLDAPGAATYAVFVSDTGAQRADDVAAIAPCFEHALGGLLGAEGAGALDGILSGWAKGRGDWDTAALVTAAPLTGVVFRAPVADADAATRSLRDLTGLLEHPPVSDAVQQLFGVLQGASAQTDLVPFGPITTLTFPRKPDTKRRGAPQPPLGLAWTTGAAEIDLGIGAAPTDLLAALRQTPRLGGDLATANAIDALGSDATFAVVLKPFDCCTRGGPTATPLTFGWGRHLEEGWSRVEIGYELLDKLAQGL